jgi:translation initiation factor 1A
MLGNGRVEAQCFDGNKRLGTIRGKMRKKVWINQGDIILVGLREFQDDKCDVILKYNADEARNLKAYGELPDSAKINETDTFEKEEGDDIDFEFDVDEVLYLPCLHKLAGGSTNVIWGGVLVASLCRFKVSIGYQKKFVC